MTTLPVASVAVHPAADGAESRIRADIQGLRGIAVLMVVLFHVGVPAFGGGFAGVDVFFVISGYVISGLLVDEIERRGRVDLPRFYARRAKRLLPASLLMIFVVVALWNLTMSPLERRDAISAGRAASVYLANFWFSGRAVDYLGGGSQDNPFLHMWSLAVEEQFYLVWPAVLWAAARWAGPRGRLRAASIVLVVLSLLSLAACIAETASNRPVAFFHLPFRAWEFGVGFCALTAARSGVGEQRPGLVRGAGWLGAAMLVPSVLLLSESLAFPGPWALLPVLATALMLFASQSGHAVLSTALAWRPLARLGDLSYSWYLWHWPALVMVKFGWPGSGLAGRGGAAAVALLIAAASLRAVENPLRHARALASLRWAAVGAALAATVASVGAITAVLAFDDRLLDREPYRAFRAGAADRAAPPDLRCQGDFDATTTGDCLFGVPTSDRHVVLVGDSHASHMFPALQRLALRHGWALHSFSKTACPMVELEVMLPNRGRAYRECSLWRENVVARIAATRPLLVVVVNHGGGYRIGAADWGAGQRRMLARLRAGGAAVALLHDTPWPDYDVPTCLSRAQWRGEDAAAACRFPAADADRRNAASRGAEAAAVGAVAGSFTIDLEPAFCSAGRCEVFADGVVRFTDAHHLTATFSDALAPALEAALQGAAATDPALQRLFAAR